MHFYSKEESAPFPYRAPSCPNQHHHHRAFCTLPKLMPGQTTQTPSKHESADYLRFLRDQIPKTPKKSDSIDFSTPRRVLDSSSSRPLLNKTHIRSEQQTTQRKTCIPTTVSLKYITLYNKSVSDFFGLKYDDIDQCAGSKSRCKVSDNCVIYEDEDTERLDAVSGESAAESAASTYFSSAPGTLWTAVEKDIFYRCLSRYSIHRIECFSEHLPRKSHIEISSFYDALQLELHRRKRRRLVKLAKDKQCWISSISSGFPYKLHPQAVEISERGIENEEQQGRLIGDDEKLWEGLEGCVSSPERFVDYERLNQLLNAYLPSTSKLLFEAYILLEELLGQRIRQIIAHIIADKPIVSGKVYFERSSAPAKHVFSEVESSDESSKDEAKPSKRRRHRLQRTSISFEEMDGAVTNRDIWAASRSVFGGMLRFGDILAVLKLRHSGMELQSSHAQNVQSEDTDETSTAVLSGSENLGSEAETTQSPASIEDSFDGLQSNSPEHFGRSMRNKILCSWDHPIDEVPERTAQAKTEFLAENTSKNITSVIDMESESSTQIDSSEEVEQALIDLETRMLEQYDAAYARSRSDAPVTRITAEIENPLGFSQKTIETWGLSYNDYIDR